MRYTHTDHPSTGSGHHLGSSSGQTDTAGNVITDSYLRYYAYGGLRSGVPSAATTDRTFTGQKADGTGLLYYNARFYDPALGTFLSPDTLVPDAGRVVDYNRFLYVRGNPLKYSDPSGHCATQEYIDHGCPNWMPDWLYKGIEYALAVVTPNSAYAPAPDGQLGDLPELVAETEGRWYQGIGFGLIEPLDYADSLDRCTSGECNPGIVIGAVVPGLTGRFGSSAFRALTESNFRVNLQRLTGKAADEVIGFEAHHILPQNFRKQFAESGLNIDDPKFGSWVDASRHRQWSYEYNVKWDRFLKDNPTVDQILKFARQLAEEYGFDVHFK